MTFGRSVREPNAMSPGDNTSRVAPSAAGSSEMRYSHARVLEGVNPILALSTFETHCLEGKFTFGDPFLDSGVVVRAR